MTGNAELNFMSCCTVRKEVRLRMLCELRDQGFANLNLRIFSPFVNEILDFFQ